MTKEDKEETQHNTEEWEKDFLDFYFETGRYEKRKTGPQEYIKFIRQLLQSAREELWKKEFRKRGLLAEAVKRETREALIDEIVKMGEGMKKHLPKSIPESKHNKDRCVTCISFPAITDYQKKIQSLKG